ncbi:hypothetical protein [Mycoplasma buteonis]|uniref:hypothetical protein n=1 Tax=Mycoplasma buteonis TaxID=171280 RepID=UPI00056B68EB|nr:hypothetical protein [Mycoplasma buteonis]
MNKKLNLFVFLQLKRIYKNNRFENLKNIKVDKNIYANLIEYSIKSKQFYLITSAFLLFMTFVICFISVFFTKSIFPEFSFFQEKSDIQVMLIFNFISIFVFDIVLLIAFLST